MGLFTKNRKALTAKGVKPVCPFLQVFKSTYLLGAFSPITGYQFMLEMSGCNGDSFQIFLTEFSNKNIDEYKIIVLDNGAFHKAKSLQIPDNVFLLFLPPLTVRSLTRLKKCGRTLKENSQIDYLIPCSNYQNFIDETSKTITAETYPQPVHSAIFLTT